jgi:uncharacterized protein involved in exopolysaccharide biosynthesis
MRPEAHSLRHYLQVVRRRQSLVIPLVVLVPVVVLILSLGEPNRFSAYSEVLVARRGESRTLRATSRLN